jgi:uncharacterized protein (TIGR03086 family)
VQDSQPVPGVSFGIGRGQLKFQLFRARHASTPSTGRDTSRMVNDIIGENLRAGELIQGKVIEQVGNAPDGDLTGDDPAAAYRRSLEVARRAVEAPDAMDATCHLSFDDYSGADYAGQLFMDTLNHGWDIAEGTGEDTRLEPNFVSACLPIAEDRRASSARPASSVRTCRSQRTPIRRPDY